MPEDPDDDLGDLRFGECRVDLRQAAKLLGVSRGVIESLVQQDPSFPRTINNSQKFFRWQLIAWQQRLRRCPGPYEPPMPAGRPKYRKDS